MAAAAGGAAAGPAAAPPPAALDPGPPFEPEQNLTRTVKLEDVLATNLPNAAGAARRHAQAMLDGIPADYLRRLRQHQKQPNIPQLEAGHPCRQYLSGPNQQLTRYTVPQYLTMRRQTAVWVDVVAVWMGDARARVADAFALMLFNLQAKGMVHLAAQQHQRREAISRVSRD